MVEAALGIIIFALTIAGHVPVMSYQDRFHTALDVINQECAAIRIN